MTYKFFMIRSLSFSLFIIFASLKCLSQENNEAAVSNVTKVTFFNPGISYEQKIGARQSLYGQLFMNTSFSFIYSSSFGSDFHLYFDPAATLQYRYYYNGNKRIAKDKRTEMNSMNYFTAVFETDLSKRPFFTAFSETHLRAISSLGLAWGLQRNYQKRFSLDLYAGLCYSAARSIYQTYPQTERKYYGTFSPIAHLNIGLWLNKMK